MTTWLAVLAWIALGGVFGALVAFAVLTGRAFPYRENGRNGRHTTERHEDERDDT